MFYWVMVKYTHSQQKVKASRLARGVGEKVESEFKVRELNPISPARFAIV
jgi:hypothetical protein